MDILKRLVKIRKKYVLFLLLIIAAIVLGSCSKPECRTSADCGQRTCFLSKCDDEKCAYELQRNCCGNRINDTIENGKPGNQCTCPQDYGRCEGKGKIKIGSRIEDALYIKYFCNVDNNCVLGVDKKDIAPQNYLDTINPGFFKASSIIKYNKPFDAERDNFEFAITLDDIGKDMVLPVSITNVKIFLSGEFSRTELLVSEKEANAVLNGVGDRALLTIPISLDYRPQELEENGAIRYTMDYLHKKKVLSGKTANGTNIFSDEIVRGSFTSPSKPAFFVRSG